jgi:dihydroorotase-like cyclic amidohydrolase
VAAAFLWVACALLVACRKQETAQSFILIQNVTVIDPEKETSTPATSVLIAAGKIQAVAPAGQLSSPNARVIDGTGKYLIPGL